MSIKNIKNSFFWWVSEVAELLESLQPRHMTVFHPCMHGGNRDKQTAWWSWNPRDASNDLFASLGLECDKQHQHKPWRPYKNPNGTLVFPTKEEAAYPKLLCDRIACILKADALKHGFVFSLRPGTTIVGNTECCRKAALHCAATWPKTATLGVRVWTLHCFVGGGWTAAAC